jgi:hypothetical protein
MHGLTAPNDCDTSGSAGEEKCGDRANAGLLTGLNREIILEVRAEDLQGARRSCTWFPRVATDPYALHTTATN